jgi:hypothetical protein
MTKEEAHKIFADWKEYIEFGDKLSKLFTVVPKYFLPYPMDTLEEALNIVAKEYFDAGDKSMAKNIQETMALHMAGYFLAPSNTEMTDDEIFEHMKEKLERILANPELKRGIIENMRNTQSSWIKFRSQKKQ